MFKRIPLFIAVLALAVWAGNFITKNFLAASLLAYGQPADGSAAAVRYAPANPEVLAARARFLLYRADEPRAGEAIALLQQATAASPRDYRYWLELGKAYDSNGQSPRAESSLQRAIELAPRYFEPRWAMANSRLRAGKSEAALEDFREAIALSGSLYGSASPRPDRNATLSAYSAIAGALGMNLDALRRVTPADSAARGYLAEFLATHDALDQALDIWRSLPGDDPLSYRNLAAQLTRELQSKNRFAEARDVWRKFSRIEGAPVDEANNLIANPGFESRPLREQYVGVVDLGEGFDWVIGRHPEVRISRGGDSVHSGANALHLVFAASMNSAFQEVSHLIAVEPSRQYRLGYFVKTKNISSAPNETPFVEVSDAAHPSAFVLRSVVPDGTTDWSEQSISFTTTDDTHGVRLMVHAPQLKTIDRPRIAELWLDDFKLSQYHER